ncbi:MAG TPA: hypothetical protein VFQ45_02685 [Longimicrobium sp.]|nr:hypothetical protein [Longimicrobium sp.]
MTTRTTGRALALLALAALAGCDGPRTTEPPPDPAEPGILTVTLATPAADDRALVVQISGPEAIGAVTSAGGGYLVHSRTAGTTVRVAVFGPLADGPLLRISVPDVRKAAAYSAQVMEVAGASHALRETLSGYSAVVAR